MKSKRIEIVGTVLGLWVWSAVISVFFTGRFPGLRPYATWSLRIYGGLLLSFMLIAGVLYPIFLAGKEVRDLYQDIVVTSKPNLFWRLWLAIWLGVGFLFAIALARF